MFSLLQNSLLLAFLLLIYPAQAARSSTPDSTVSQDKILSGTFANDATFRTDYYFTQGLTASLVHPGLQHAWANKLFLRPGAGATRYYGLRLRYDGFTPLKILDPLIRYGDRPYAAYIYTTSYQIANNPHRKQRFTSGVDVGFIGPGTGGGQLQTKIHEWLDSPKPQGWHHQIQTDLVLGYTAALEKQVLAAGKVVELLGNVGASAGTLYTHATGGLLLRTGKMNSYFQNLGITSRPNRQGTQKFQFYGLGRLTGKLVGYNATLQGGLFHKHNPYTLAAGDLKRGLLQKEAGLVGAYGGFSFESSVVWLTPEFKGARSHQWMHFEVRFSL